MAVQFDVPLSLGELERAVAAAERTALLAPPRILRRLIKHDRQIGGIGLKVPHRKTYTIEAGPLLKIVDRDELGLEPTAGLSGSVILLARPDAEKLAGMTSAEALVKYWRLLFHARVHTALERRVAEGRLDEAAVCRRIHRIGQAQFAEIRAVLRVEDFLLPPLTNRSVYVEFAAVYLELKYFASSLLSHYFPSLGDLNELDQILAEDVDHQRLFAETRLPGAPDPATVASDAELEPAADESEPDELHLVAAQPSERAYRKLNRRADRAAAVGNSVRAAILRARAARRVRPSLATRARSAARQEIKRLADRLQDALDLSDKDARHCLRGLSALLGRSVHGFWTRESRALYDLQKVCVDYEREVYALDLAGWALSWGRRPIRRPLPGQRDVLMSKHLRSAARRVAAARITENQRSRLAQLLDAAMHRAERKLRVRFRPLVLEALERVGLAPQNLPERVARDKLVEELLDRVVERGFLAMGDLRDAISRNNLKLDDLSGAKELVSGDRLLRADSRLATTLDGVYRGGEMYLRWPQRLSSLAFGTRLGRMLVRFVVLPFGGAFVTLEFVRHTITVLVGGPSSGGHAVSDSAAAAVAHAPGIPLWVAIGTMLLGFVLVGVFNNQSFRRGLVGAAVRLFRLARMVLVELPAWIVRQPLVRKLLDSAYFRLFTRYVFKPLLFTALALAAFPGLREDAASSVNSGVLVFLTANLLLNSRLGRNAEEVITDWIVRNWEHFRIRILKALVQIVIDFFNRVVDTLDRILYSVDEWLRFRSGQSRASVVAKALLGSIWFMVAYFVRFCINLLIEPQINPVKHFPVVTVSHKILLSMSLFLYENFMTPLEPFLGAVVAKTVFGTGLFVLPGVFGFLVWELKENWRLYHANRPKVLGPVAVGHHGETMVRLLRPGFHSGTVPKLYTRLRRANRKAHWTGSWKASRKYRASLDRVRDSVRSFIEREFLAVLRHSRRWQSRDVSLGRVQVGSTTVQFELCANDPGTPPLWIALEEHSGWLAATARETGWVAELEPEALQALADALTGFYKMAGVDLVREQIEAVLVPAPWLYDITEDALVAWPDASLKGEAVYPLNDGPLIQPRTSVSGHAPLPELKQEQIVFSSLPIMWSWWVEIWNCDQTGGGCPTPLTAGAQVLPQAIDRAAAPPLDTAVNRANPAPVAEWGHTAR